MALSGAIFVPLALWDVSVPEAWRLLRQADWRPIALAMLLFVATLAAKTARWQAFFTPRPNLLSLFAALMIGQLGNFFLPARLGDVARVYVLTRRVGQPVARIVGTIAAEKLVELAILAVLAVLVAAQVPLPGWLIDPSLRLGALLLVCVGSLLVAYALRARMRSAWLWVGARVFKSRPAEVNRQVNLALQGFASLAQVARAAQIAIWSLVIWFLMCATNYVLFYSVSTSASWLVATVLLLVLQVGVAIPSSPGKIGIFQALVNLTLGLFGINREVAFSYGLLLYLVIVVPQAACAGPFVLQELVSLRHSRRVAAASIGES